MAISVDLASEALVISAFVLTAFAVPKLIVYFAWAVFKMRIYKRMDKVARSRFFTSVIRGDLREELVKESDKLDIRVKWMSKAYLDYLRDIKEPLVEGLTAIVIIFVVSVFIGLEPPFSLIFGVLAFILAALLLTSLLMVILIVKELNKIKKEPEKPPE